MIITLSGNSKSWYNSCIESNNPRRINMSKWLEPSATEMRFGFEVTMYIINK